MIAIDLPPGDSFPHGTRARYVGAKCRCIECRKANAAYTRGRVGKPYNGLVDASKARAHLEHLSTLGVGKRSVSAASDIALSVLQDIRNGLKTRIRASTERRILAVDITAASDGSAIPAKETRAALRELRKAGLTKQEIAVRLGSTAKRPGLQLTKPRVSARNAYKVQRLLAEVRAELALEERIGVICGECGDSHDTARRLEWLRVHREGSREDLIEARPCWYGGKTGRNRLSSDMRALRGEAS